VLILFVANGPTKGKVIELSDEIHLIGRQSEEVQLNDSRVSRRHAELIPGDEGWLIRDVGSSNGTAVNGKWLAGGSPVAVKAGDRIQVGRTLMIVGDGESRIMPKPRRSSRSKSKSRSKSSSRDKAAAAAAPIEPANLDDELAAVIADDSPSTDSSAGSPLDTPESPGDSAPAGLPTLDDVFADDEDISIPMDGDDDDDSRVALDTSRDDAAHDDRRTDESQRVASADDALSVEADDDDRMVIDLADESSVAPAIDEDPLDAIELNAARDDDDDELLVAADDSLAGVLVDLDEQVDAMEVGSDDVAALAAASGSARDEAEYEDEEVADDLADDSLLIGELIDDERDDINLDDEEPAEALLDASRVDDSSSDEADDRAMADVARVLYPQRPDIDDESPPQVSDTPAPTKAFDGEEDEEIEAAELEDVAFDEMVIDEPSEDIDLVAEPAAGTRSTPREPVESVADLIGDDALEDTDAHTAPAEDPADHADTPNSLETPELVEADELSEVAEANETPAVPDAPTDRVAASFADLDAMFADLDVEDDASEDDEREPSADRASVAHYPDTFDALPQLEARVDEHDTAIAVEDLMDEPVADHDDDTATLDANLEELPGAAIAASDWSGMDEPADAIVTAVDAANSDSDIVVDTAADLSLAGSFDSDDADDAHGREVTHDLLMDDEADDTDRDEPLDVAAVLGGSSNAPTVDELLVIERDPSEIDAADMHDDPAVDQEADPYTNESEHDADDGEDAALTDVAEATGIEPYSDHDAVHDRFAQGDVTVDDPAGFVGSHTAAHDEPHIAASDDKPAAVDESPESLAEPVAEDIASFDVMLDASGDASTDEVTDEMRDAASLEVSPDDSFDTDEAALNEFDGRSDINDALPDVEDIGVTQSHAAAPMHDAQDEPSIKTEADADAILREPIAPLSPLRSPVKATAPADLTPPTPSMRAPSMGGVPVPEWDVEEAKRSAPRLHPAWKVLIPVVLAAVIAVGVFEVGNRYDWWAYLQQSDSLNNATAPTASPTRLQLDLEAAKANQKTNPTSGAGQQAGTTGPDPTDPTISRINSIRDIIHEEIKPTDKPPAPMAVDPRD